MAWEWLTGSSGEMMQTPTMTKEQQSMQNQLISSLFGPQNAGTNLLMQWLSSNPEAMAAFEAPYKRQFEQETVPSIAERFAGMGSFGSGSGSGQNMAMAQAGRELSENLAALRGNLQQNALQQLQGYMQQGFTPAFENVYKPPSQGILQGAAGGIGQGIGTYFGSKMWS